MDAVHQRRLGRGGAVGDGNGASFANLVTRLLNELVRLLDQKLTLLKLELKEELGAAARRVALLAVGVAVGAFGGLFLILALTIWVGELVGSMPGGFAIVGGLLALGGGIVFLSMRRQLAEQRFVPVKTVQELRRDAEWIKHEL
jgi:uncharacterized membrane protein YqjE